MLTFWASDLYSWTPLEELCWVLLSLGAERQFILCLKQVTSINLLQPWVVGGFKPRTFKLWGNNTVLTTVPLFCPWCYWSQFLPPFIKAFFLINEVTIFLPNDIIKHCRKLSEAWALAYKDYKQYLIWASLIITVNVTEKKKSVLGLGSLWFIKTEM